MRLFVLDNIRYRGGVISALIKTSTKFLISEQYVIKIIGFETCDSLPPIQPDIYYLALIYNPDIS